MSTYAHTHKHESRGRDPPAGTPISLPRNKRYAKASLQSIAKAASSYTFNNSSVSGNGQPWDNAMSSNVGQNSLTAVPAQESNSTYRALRSPGTQRTAKVDLGNDSQSVATVGSRTSARAGTRSRSRGRGAAGARALRWLGRWRGGSTRIAGAGGQEAVHGSRASGSALPVGGRRSAATTSTTSTSTSTTAVASEATGRAVHEWHWAV